MHYSTLRLAFFAIVCAGLTATCASDVADPTSDAQPTLRAPAPAAKAARTPELARARDAESAAPVPASDVEDGTANSEAPEQAEQQFAGGDEDDVLDHDFFSTVWIDDKDSATLSILGDLWPSCWSDDDAVYTTSGDGIGFGLQIGEMLVHRIDGRPGDARDRLRGTTLAAGTNVAPRWNLGYTIKPTGMLCVHGELYIAAQDLLALQFSDAPAATIVRSVDKGRTWSWDSRAPMFSDHVFTTIMFADFGKDNEHAPDEFAYAYGLDDNWSATYSSRPPQTKLYLARVPTASVQNRSKWEFFTGLDQQGTPTWSPDIVERAPVLEDNERRYAMPLDDNIAFRNMTTFSQGGVVYNAGLKRYIYSTWTAFTFELYEAPQPWGPWTHFYTKDFGAFPWTEDAAGGYGTPIPSKFISEDGRSMWMNSNVWQAGVLHYQYALRRISVNPYEPSTASNPRSSQPLSTSKQQAVPLVRSSHSGRVQQLNDGVTKNQSLESWTGDHSSEDYWGFTWPHVVHVNKVRYTTGADNRRGGWFEDLGVQVREGRKWVAVTGLKVTPEYAGGRAVLGYKTFTLSFDEKVTDGVRISGRPGGGDEFTNVAELSVSYE